MKKLILFILLIFTAGCDDSSENNKTNPLSWLAVNIPTSAPAYENISGNLVCNGDPLSPPHLEITAEDTCAGVLSDGQASSGTYTFKSGEENTGCQISIRCTDGEFEILHTQEVVFTSELDITDYDFSGWEEFDRPIEDYITACASELGHMSFRQSISEMTVFDRRLYIGWGDADLNLGRVFPVEIRSYTSLDPSSLQTEAVTQEEEISLYRITGGTLVVPGVDATEDNLIGNTYILDNGQWVKNRSLEWAWHVHDTLFFDGSYMSVGSGGSLDDYNNSTVRSFVWSSTDGIEDNTVVFDNPHPQPPGDNRFTHLLGAGSKMYVFGYVSASNSTYSQYFEYDGTSFESMTTPPNFFIFNSWATSEDSGLVSGVKIASPLAYGVMKWTPDGFQAIDAFDGLTVYDMFVMDDGRVLAMYIEGDSYPDESERPWNFKVGLFDTDGSLTEIFDRMTEVKPVSIAWYEKNILIGLADGSIQIVKKSW